MAALTGSDSVQFLRGRVAYLLVGVVREDARASIRRDNIRASVRLSYALPLRVKVNEPRFMAAKDRDHSVAIRIMTYVLRAGRMFYVKDLVVGGVIAVSAP